MKLTQTWRTTSAGMNQEMPVYYLLSIHCSNNHLKNNHLFIKTDSKEIIQKKDLSAREISQLIKLEKLHNIKKLSALLPCVCT